MTVYRFDVGSLVVGWIMRVVGEGRRDGRWRGDLFSNEGRT